jgi:DNA-binding transcriptional MocR family regulator
MVAVLAASRVATLAGDFPQSPAYRGLADALRTLIAEGRVPVGVRLPSERNLTSALDVSRTTVTRAYDLLREERYLESRQGSGSVTRLPVSRVGRTDHLLMMRTGLDEPVDDSSIDLTIATPPAPPGTAAAYERAVARLPAYMSGTGYYPTGVPALREALAQRYADRGLPTAPEQIVVVAGALAGLAVSAQLLVGPGDRALVETPTYPNSITTLRARRARLVTTAVDPVHGWDTDAAVQSARGTRLAYLVPDFHNPTGALMPESQRAQLGDALTAARSVPVVDEAILDVCLDDEPMPAPFACFAPDAITLGSASKGFWGGLRIGWVRAPLHRVREVTAARMSLDLASPPLEQLALLEMLEAEPEIRRHHRAGLNASRDALLVALGRHLPEWRVAPGRGGLAVWCRLPLPLSSSLSVTAEDHGVYLAAGPSFAPDGGLEHWLRLPHTLPPAVLTDAVRRLAPAWEEARSGRHARQERTVVVA